MRVDARPAVYAGKFQGMTNAHALPAARGVRAPVDPRRGTSPLPTVGMVPSCLFNVISQNDAHGRCEHFQQLFPRAGVERL